MFQHQTAKFNSVKPQLLLHQPNRIDSSCKIQYALSIVCLHEQSQGLPKGKCVPVKFLLKQIGSAAVQPGLMC